jgi:isoleucyl-tRNA synthetase
VTLGVKKVRPAISEDVAIETAQAGSVENAPVSEDRGGAANGKSAKDSAVDPSLTIEAVSEKIAGEVIELVRDLRRSAGFDITDHIVTYYEGDADFIQVISSFADYIMQETLSRELVEGIPPDADRQEAYKLAGKSIILGVKKVD